MLHVAVDVVVETVDLAVVVVVTTVILEAVMVTVSPLRKHAFQSLSMRNVVYMAVLVVVVVDVVKLVTVNVLEGHSSVIVELAKSLS